MANSSLSLTSLDFDGIKNNLKTYMQSQTTFKDYDFEGSNINVLLDILSYNTYMNAFYLNMTASEGFLDSAQMRSSVVSHAKELNYTPRSARSAKGVVDLSIRLTSGSTNLIEIPKGTQFSGVNSLGSFVFTTDQTHTISSVNNIFELKNLAIYEGTYINESFTVNNTVPNQKFIMSNKNIDTHSIVVTVIEDNGLNTNNFQEAANLFGLNTNSNVYFLQATLDGYYEIVFGDNAFGRKPQNNATILVTYRITKGAAGNNVKSFRIDKDLGPINGVILTTTTSVRGISVDGAAEESIDSIRFRAPKHYQTQDRAITNQDYENIIYENFPDVKAVHVYGGETIFGSVQYGKVFISPLSLSGATITDSLKADIVYYLSNKNSIAIEPVIIDPDFLYILPTITAYVDFRKTSMTPAEVKNLVYSTIDLFNVKYLQNFNTTFSYSRLISSLIASDDSISSVKMSIIGKKIVSPILNSSRPFSVAYNNELIPGTISSSQFRAKSSDNENRMYIFTDYNPNLQTIKRSGDLNTYTVTNTSNVLYLREIIPERPTSGNYTPAGTINYKTGTINIIEISIIDFMNDPGIVFKASPLNNDLTSVKNDLIEFDLANITTTVESV